MTPKEELNRLSSWESLAWCRQILSLVYFLHLFHQCPYILSHIHFHPSQMPRRPCSIVLLQSGSSFSKSPLFLLSIAWNKLPENICAITAPSAFNSEIRKLFSAHMFSLRGIPDFCTWFSSCSGSYTVSLIFPFLSFLLLYLNINFSLIYMYIYVVRHQLTI